MESVANLHLPDFFRFKEPLSPFLSTCCVRAWRRCRWLLFPRLLSPLNRCSNLPLCWPRFAPFSQTRWKAWQPIMCARHAHHSSKVCLQMYRQTRRSFEPPSTERSRCSLFTSSPPSQRLDPALGHRRRAGATTIRARAQLCLSRTALQRLPVRLLLGRTTFSGMLMPFYS